MVDLVEKREHDAGADTHHAKGLGLVDIVGLTVGAIVGADIYVASAFGSGRLGPAALIGWIIAGCMAMTIALSCAQCAMVVQRVGGPYAYVGEAFGPFPGYLVGWSLWLAEWTSLAVFPIAFARYLQVFLPDLSPVQVGLAKALFVAFVTITNLYGSRIAGLINDALAAFKLVPLLLLTALGLLFVVLHADSLQANLSPFFPKGLQELGPALVLIFWAFAGFELATIPSGEVRNPRRTIPLAILIGMLIVTVFYLLTNFVLLSVVRWNALATTQAPLTQVFGVIISRLIPGFTALGTGFMTLSALVSIAGSDESGTLGTSRLAYAMAADGLLPKVFARINPANQTPYVALLFQNASALVAALLGTLGGLIRVAVFFLGVAYLATSLAAIALRHRNPDAQLRLPGSMLIPYLGAASALVLLSQVGWRPFLAGLALMLAGTCIYSYFTPQSELAAVRKWVAMRRYHEAKARHVTGQLLAVTILFVAGLWRRNRV